MEYDVIFAAFQKKWNDAKKNEKVTVGIELQSRIEKLLSSSVTHLSTLKSINRQERKDLLEVSVELSLNGNMLHVVRNPDAYESNTYWKPFFDNKYFQLLAELDENLHSPNYKNLNGAFQLIALYAEISSTVEPIIKEREESALQDECLQYAQDTSLIKHEKAESYPLDMESTTNSKPQGHNAEYPIADKYKPIISLVFSGLNGIAFTLTESLFGVAIENANLFEVYQQGNCIKNKIAYMIYILSIVMGQNWYKDASNSIGLPKNKCSGANVEDDMKQLKKKVKAMKDQIDK